MIELEENQSKIKNLRTVHAKLLPQLPDRREQEPEQEPTDDNGSGDAPQPTLIKEKSEAEQSNSVWQGWQGTLIMLFGVVAPSIVIAAVAYNSCAVTAEMVLRHPVETLAQMALAVCIPVGNVVVWARLKQSKVSKVIRLGILNGLAIGASIFVLIGSVAALFLRYPLVEEITLVSKEQSVAICAVTALAAMIVSIRLTQLLSRHWQTQGARVQQLMCSLTGVILSVLALGGTEARSIFIKFYEQEATAGSVTEKPDALNALRAIGAASELRMDINVPRSSGLTGMFTQSDQSTRKQLYFALTAKPYRALQDLPSQDEGNGSLVDAPNDPYFSTHVVGSELPGLSLLRSQVSGSLNAKTLTSNLDWTFVFKNKNFSDEEARAEIALPPGAVISNMTLWMNGEPKGASVAPNEAAEGAYKWVVVSKRDPALLTYIGRGRVLLQCYPVPANKEMKVQISITAPMKLDTGTEASLTFPRVLSANFAKPKFDDLRLLSSDKLSLPCVNLHKFALPGGDTVYSGKLEDETLNRSALSIEATPPLSVGSYAALDRVRGGYAVESVKEVENNSPKQLVVVVDGSETLKANAKDISNMLRTVSKTIPTSAIIVNSDQEDSTQPLPAEKAAHELDTMKFEGGHDNLPALLAAAELAGDREREPYFGYMDHNLVSTKKCTSPQNSLANRTSTIWPLTTTRRTQQSSYAIIER